jgi:hypothetical protein
MKRDGGWHGDAWKFLALTATCLLALILFNVSAAGVRAASILGRGALEVRVVPAPVQQGYVVYADSGIPADSDVWTWDGSAWNLPPGYFDGSYIGENPPEGTMCFKTRSGSGSGNYAGWGVFLCKPSDHTVDLSGYTQLKFWVKVSEDACVGLYVQVQQGSRTGPKSNMLCVNLYGWTQPNTWQEITIPRSEFTGVDFTRIFSPFMITITKGDAIFYVDNVRWV